MLTLGIPAKLNERQNVLGGILPAVDHCTVSSFHEHPDIRRELRSGEVFDSDDLRRTMLVKDGQNDAVGYLAHFIHIHRPKNQIPIGLHVLKQSIGIKFAKITEYNGFINVCT